MKIGMILDGIFPPDPRVENEAISLIKEGHEVSLFCITHAKGDVKEEIINGIQVKRFYLPKIFKSLSSLAYTFPVYHFKLLPLIKNFLKKNHFDFIHVHDIQVARAVFWATKRFHNIPVTLDLHENRPEIMKFYHHVNSALGKLLIYPSLWKKNEYKFIRKADKVVVVTEAAKEYYIKHANVSPSKFIVTPNTTRKSFYTDFDIKEDIKLKYENRYNLLYVGETGQRRGIATAIKAIARLKDEIPQINLIVVGTSKDINELKSLSKTLGLDSFISFEGWQNFELFPSYIESADVCISPLHRNIHHDTTFANKLFQYMAFAKPVLVSNCKAQETVVSDHQCGLVFEAENEADFSEKLLYLYQNKEHANSMGSRGEKAVKEYLNWESTSKGLLNYYNE